MSFLHTSPGTIASDKTERTPEGREQLEAFRGLVQQRMCSYWSSPADMGAKVRRSLVKLIKNKPAVGWVRGNLLPVDLQTEEAQEIRGLRETNEKLDQQVKEQSSEIAELKR